MQYWKNFDIKKLWCDRNRKILDYIIYVWRRCNYIRATPLRPLPVLRVLSVRRKSAVASWFKNFVYSKLYEWIFSIFQAVNINITQCDLLWTLVQQRDEVTFNIFIWNLILKFIFNILFCNSIMSRVCKMSPHRFRYVTDNTLLVIYNFYIHFKIFGNPPTRPGKNPPTCPGTIPLTFFTPTPWCRY